MALDETSKVISLSCKAFDVSFNIKSTICNNCSFVNESKLIISSTLFKNSGLKYSFNLSISLSLLTVSFPKPIELLLTFEPAFDVIIIIVLEKLTVFPWLSVNLPSSNTCNKMLNTSG